MSLGNGKRTAMIIWKAGVIVIVPVPVVAKYRNHGACLATGPLTVLECDIRGLLSLVSAPEKAMRFISA